MGQTSDGVKFPVVVQLEKESTNSVFEVFVWVRHCKPREMLI